MKIKEADKQPLSPGLRPALAIISHAVVFADADRPRRDAQIGTDACERITRDTHSTLSQSPTGGRAGHRRFGSDEAANRD